MSSLGFSLQPFSPATSPGGQAITGRIEKRSSTLAIQYVMEGQQAALAIPPLANIPSRKQRLWEETCFEFFLDPGGSKGCYWEFNLSPAGHWNVYRFSDYREGMREEPSVTAVPFSLLNDQHSLQVYLELDLSPIIPPDCSLRVGISAVIKTKDGLLSYWALKHPGPRPDFHHRDGFSIDL
jgi:hypothetical protein